MQGSGWISPLAWRTPLAMRAVISVAALPISIWPQAMSYLRPSSEVALVSPVIPCLVAVYGAEFGRGACAETLALHDSERFLDTQERPGQVDIHYRFPLLVSEIFKWDAGCSDSRVVE